MVDCWGINCYERPFRELGIVFVLVFVSVLACSPRFAMAAAADSWKAEWEQTLSAAKKEVEISFYGSQGY